MNANTLKTKFQLRRDLEENWRTANPQLADGEPILVDVNGVYKLKIGDGNTYFNDLPYYGGGGSGDADWATLLNKPFYEKQIAEQTITIDYTEGLVPNTEEMIAIKKISGEVYSAEEIKQFTFSYDVLSRGSIETITNAKATDENMEIEPVSTSVVFEETLFISTNTPGLTLDFGTLPEAGTYALYLGNAEDGIRLNSFTIPAHTELKKIDKKFLHLDWADVENKPFGEVQVPATHYDLSDTSKYTDVVDATDYGEYGEFYRLSDQNVYFNQLMQDGFSIDYKLNGEVYTIASTDCVMTPHDLEGNVVSSTENGNYMETTYTDTDGDIILKFLLIYSLPDGDSTSEITYNGKTGQVSYGDVYAAKYIKKIKTSDIEHPTMKIVEPIKVYTTPSYSFNQNETPINLMEENFYKVTNNIIPSTDMVNLKGYICNGTESSISSGPITQGNASDFGDNATVDGFELYYVDDKMPFLQATKDHATAEFDSEGEHVSLELPTQGIYFMRTEAEGNVYCVKSIGVNIEFNFDELGNGYFREGEYLDGSLILLYNIGELNLTIDNWKNAIDFGMISYDIKNYDPSDPETYDKSSSKEEFDEENTWEEVTDELFTEDYDYLSTVFQIKKPNVEFEGITFENPGVYLLKMIDEDVIMEAYLDLPAKESVQKLDNKYIDFNWNNLENKPFGVIATCPATTYEITEPFPQDYFVYSSQDGNEQKLYSSSFPQIKSSEDQVYITLSIETDGVQSFETYTATDLIQSQQTDENNYPYALIEIARSSGNLPVAVMNPNSKNNITYNNQSVAPGFYAIKTTLTTINNDLSGFSTTVITPQRIYSNAELTYTGDYSGTPDVSFIGGDLYRIGDYQSADLTQKYFGIETMSEGSSTTNYYMPTNMTQSLLSSNENNSFDNGTIYGFENANDVMVVNVSQDNSSLIFYENSDTEGEDPTRIEVTFDAGLYATRKFTDVSNYQEIKTIGQNFDMDFISSEQSPVQTINNNMAIKTAYFNYGKLPIYSKDQFVNGTATAYQDGTSLDSITLNETNFVEKEDYFLYKNNEDVVFIVCNNNHKTYAEEVDEELHQGLYLGMSGTVDSEGLHLTKVAINTNEFEDIKKLDEKFLPDNIGGGSDSSSGGNSGSAGVTSWNDLEDKPFGEVTVAAEGPLARTDGTLIKSGSNTLVGYSNNYTIYKVSNNIYNSNSFDYITLNVSQMSADSTNDVLISNMNTTGMESMTTYSDGSLVFQRSGIVLFAFVVNEIELTDYDVTLTGPGTYLFSNTLNVEGNDYPFTINSITVAQHTALKQINRQYVNYDHIDYNNLDNKPYGEIPTVGVPEISHTLSEFNSCGGSNPTINMAFSSGYYYYRIGDALSLSELQSLSVTIKQKAYIDNNETEQYSNSITYYTYGYSSSQQLKIYNNKDIYSYNTEGEMVYFSNAFNQENSSPKPLLINYRKTDSNSLYYKTKDGYSYLTSTGNLSSGLYIGILHEYDSSIAAEVYNYPSRIVGYMGSVYIQQIAPKYLDLSEIDTELTSNTNITDSGTTYTLNNWVDNKISNATSSGISATATVNDNNTQSTLTQWTQNKINASIAAITPQSILNYDTLTNWEASDAILSMGEPALASFTDSKNQKKYVMKFGDGTNTFANLPYFKQYTIKVSDTIPTAATVSDDTITFVI